MKSAVADTKEEKERYYASIADVLAWKPMPEPYMPIDN